MNTPRMLMLLGVTLAAGLESSAQVQTSNPQVQFILVNQGASYMQTGAATVIADPQTPYTFKVAIEGQDMTSTTPVTEATFSGPSVSSRSMSYNAQENRWEYIDSQFASMTSLNAAYGVGNYVVDITGAPSGSATISVASFANTQLQIPQLTLSGGMWSDGIYMISDMASLTVSFNSIYSGSISGTQAFHYDASLASQNTYHDVSEFVNFDPTNSSTPLDSNTPTTWVIGTLSSGFYSLNVSYDDVQNPGPVFNDTAFGASLLTYRTSLSIQVVPEPATWASLVLGLAGIGFFLRRRAKCT